MRCEYAVEVTHEPLSNQVTASAFMPPSVMAARAFNEKVTTRVAAATLKFQFVGKRRHSHTPGRISAYRRARPAYANFSPLGSAVQVTIFCDSRSHHALATIPWVAGSAPVEIVAWPTQVSVAA